LNKLEEDLESSIDDKPGELDELKQRIDTFEDETVDDIKEDIDYLKDEVKKSVTVPTDLNEKWNSVRDNANLSSGVIQDFDNINNFTKEIDDAVGDRRNEIEQLQKDLESSIDDKRGELDELKQRMDTFEDETVDNIKEDINLLKDNATYLENGVIESLIGDVSEHYDEFIQLQNDVIKLKKGPSLPFPLNTNTDSSLTAMTWEECMQTIYFLFGTINYGEYPIDFGFFTDECQNPDGQTADAWTAWIKELRSAKTNWE
jgi:DNA repair exonuclease SbcCD ATPase subunit